MEILVGYYEDSGLHPSMESHRRDSHREVTCSDSLTCSLWLLCGEQTTEVGVE